MPPFRTEFLRFLGVYINQWCVSVNQYTQFKFKFARTLRSRLNAARRINFYIIARGSTEWRFTRQVLTLFHYPMASVWDTVEKERTRHWSSDVYMTSHDGNFQSVRLAKHISSRFLSPTPTQSAPLRLPHIVSAPGGRGRCETRE